MAGPEVSEKDIEMVKDALVNGWYGKNAYYYCELFQEKFAKYHDRKYALMTPNCTTAIHLLLLGLGIGKNDEVIVPECTWIATAAPITWCRAKTVFADIDKESWCISPESVLERITKHTKAIIAVNLFGNMAEMDKLREICEEKNIYLIEDAAESLGSTYRGIRSGKFGIGSVFSFHRTKTITTGEGGMLLTDDDSLYERCKFLRDHGRSEDVAYWNLEVAYKYMPFNVQAALGLAQFLRLEELLKKKKELHENYKILLREVSDIRLNYEPDYVYNSIWITGLEIGEKYRINKIEMMDRLKQLGIPSRPFFYPLSSLPAYQKMMFKKEIHRYQQQNKNAYDISRRSINLPCAFTVTLQQQQKICDSIKKILSER